VSVPSPLPRLVVAGLSGGSGKTIVSLGLLLAAQRRGLPVRAFKKGPDYIDAAWLGWATGGPVHNLDTFLMGFENVVASFTSNAVRGGFNLIEGNRGLYDGFDAKGTHSTAELAKALRAPVVLVLDATKVTRTSAAMVLGRQYRRSDSQPCERAAARATVARSYRSHLRNSCAGRHPWNF